MKSDELVAAQGLFSTKEIQYYARNTRITLHASLDVGKQELSTRHY